MRIHSYDSRTQNLEVQFQPKGKLYTYCHVPYVWAELMLKQERRKHFKWIQEHLKYFSFREEVLDVR